MGGIVCLAMLSTFLGLIVIKTKQSRNKHKLEEDIDPDFIEINNMNNNNQNASPYPPVTPVTPTFNTTTAPPPPPPPQAPYDQFYVQGPNYLSQPPNVYY